VSTVNRPSSFPDVRDLTFEQRRELVREILLANHRRPQEAARGLFVRMRRALMVITGISLVVLLPWTLKLAVSLPSRYHADDWTVAWVGFDIGLMLAFLTTGTLAWRRSPLTQYAALAAGVLLLCDAWFDVTLSRGGDFRAAILAAVLVELPLAAVMLAVGTRPGRLLARRR
jgi:hypothetical protein